MSSCVSLSDPDLEYARRFIGKNGEDAYEFALEALGGPSYLEKNKQVELMPVGEPDVLCQSTFYRDLFTDNPKLTGPATYLHVRRRAAAWHDTLERAGLTAEHLVHTDFSAGDGARATAALLDLPARRRPTAVTFGNDVMALAALAVATRRGLRVPGDLAVTGFDDTDLAQHVEPPLASVHTDVEGWGRACAAALLAAVDGGPPAHVDLAPARMVPRASLGAHDSSSRTRLGTTPRKDLAR